MPWLLSAQDVSTSQPFDPDVERLQITAELNQPAKMTFELRSRELPVVYPDQPLTFAANGAPALKLHLRSLQADRSVHAVLPTPEAQPSPSGLRVTQCGAEEAVADFVNRSLLSKALEPPGKADCEIEAAPSAFRPGTVVWVQPGDTALDCQRRLVGWMKRASATLRGLSQPFGDARYRLVSFNPGTGDPNLYFDADDPGWQLASDGEETALVRHLRSSDLDSVLQALQVDRPETRDVQLLDRSGPVECPRLPTTVRKGGRDYFCRRVSFQLTCDLEEDVPNVAVTLALTDGSEDASDHATYAGLRMVCGKFDGWDGGPDSRLLRIRPASPHDLGQRELERFGEWEVGGGEFLLATQIVPGFVRAGVSSLYTRFQRGDLLVLGLEYGTLPFVLGSLQQRREALEASSAPEVTVSGGDVLVQSLTEAGESTGTDLVISNQGTVALRAAESFSALDNLTMEHQKLEIRSESTIHGDVRVGGDSKFEGLSSFERASSFGADMTVSGAATVEGKITGAAALEVAETLAVGASAGIADLGTFADNLAPAAASAVSGAANGLARDMARFTRDIESAFQNLESELSTGLEDAAAGLRDVLEQTAGRAHEDLKEIQTSLKDSLANASSSLETWARDLEAEAEQALTQTWESASQELESIGHALEEAGGTVGRPLQEQLDRLESSVDKAERVAATHVREASEALEKRWSDLEGVVEKRDRIESELRSAQAEVEAAVLRKAAEAMESIDQEVARLERAVTEHLGEFEAAADDCVATVHRAAKKAEIDLRSAASRIEKEVPKLEDDLRRAMQKVESEIREEAKGLGVRVRQELQGLETAMTESGEALEEVGARKTREIVESVREVEGKLRASIDRVLEEVPRRLRHDTPSERMVVASAKRALGLERLRNQLQDARRASPLAHLSSQLRDAVARVLETSAARYSLELEKLGGGAISLAVGDENAAAVEALGKEVAAAREDLLEEAEEARQLLEQQASDVPRKFIGELQESPELRALSLAETKAVGAAQKLETQAQTVAASGGGWLGGRAMKRASDALRTLAEEHTALQGDVSSKVTDLVNRAEAERMRASEQLAEVSETARREVAEIGARAEAGTRSAAAAADEEMQAARPEAVSLEGFEGLRAGLEEELEGLKRELEALGRTIAEASA